MFARKLTKLARKGGNTDVLMIDATHLKAHRTASSLELKKGRRPPDWFHQGWIERETACCNRRAWLPIRMFLAQDTKYAALGNLDLAANEVDAGTTTRGAQKFPRAASERISLSNVRSDTARVNPGDKMATESVG